MSDYANLREHGATEERPRKRTAAWVWLGFTGLLTFLAFALARPDEDADPLVYSYEFTASAIFQMALLIIAAGVIAYIYAAADWRRTLGLGRFTRGDVGLAAGITIVALVVGSIIEIFLNAGDRQGISADTWDSSRVAPFVINAALIIGLGPFVEELLFRGVGVRVLSVFGAPAAIPRIRCDVRSRARHLGGAPRADTVRSRAGIRPVPSGQRVPSPPCACRLQPRSV